LLLRKLFGENNCSEDLINRVSFNSLKGNVAPHKQT